MLTVIGAGIGILMAGGLVSFTLYFVLKTHATVESPVTLVVFVLSISPALGGLFVEIVTTPNCLLWSLGVLVGIFLSHKLFSIRASEARQASSEPSK